ncbi:unnamed protein product, partial [Candidula unifasciata]
YISHRALVTPCNSQTAGQELLAHFPQFLPQMRFPSFFPRLPRELPAASISFPPVSTHTPVPTLFFTLADLDLCLYGNSSWLIGGYSGASKTRAYAFSGIRVSQYMNGKHWDVV